MFVCEYVVHMIEKSSRSWEFFAKKLLSFTSKCSFRRWLLSAPYVSECRLREFRVKNFNLIYLKIYLPFRLFVTEAIIIPGSNKWFQQWRATDLAIQRGWTFIEIIIDSVVTSFTNQRQIKYYRIRANATPLLNRTSPH